MVAKYISCDIKINIKIVQNCCRNLAVKGLSVLGEKIKVGIVLKYATLCS